MKRTIAFILLVAMGSAVFVGCFGKQTVPEETDKLTVGLDDTFAPMGFRDKTGELVGFDIDMARAVGKQMGVEIVFQSIDWDAKQQELDSKNIDCIWNGMTRTPDREETMTLSQDYLKSRVSVMTIPEVVIDSKEQLVDYKIGTQAESSELAALQKDEIYGLIADNLSEYGTYDECILNMQAGRIQAIIVDDVLGQFKNKDLNPKMNISSVSFGDSYYAIGFRKADTELCKKVEEAFKQVVASGEGGEISEKWFGTDMILDMK